jgi:hypothetical protein
MHRATFAITLLAAVLGSTHVRAEARSKSLGAARPEVAAEAVAHYARSRALLVSALHEFDKGRKLAKPDELLDSAKWRNTLIDRAEDLERVLDPQPRVTKGGIKFEADSRLLPEAKK